MKRKINIVVTQANAATHSRDSGRPICLSFKSEKNAYFLNSHYLIPWDTIPFFIEQSFEIRLTHSYEKP